MDKRVLVAGEIAVNSEAFESLITLCEKFGSRFSFTPEEKAAADFLATRLREYGLQEYSDLVYFFRGGYSDS